MTCNALHGFSHVKLRQSAPLPRSYVATSHVPVTHLWQPAPSVTSASIFTLNNRTMPLKHYSCIVPNPALRIVLTAQPVLTIDTLPILAACRKRYKT